MKTFSVTTPIYYVNDVPHIGHAYATFAVDVLARYYRRKFGKEQVWFSTGTDENSQKTVEAAQKQGKDIQQYTDELAGVWRSAFEKLGIEFNDFIRTTEPRHKAAVEHFLKQMKDAGDIYKGTYEGWYCIGHEAFLKESDLVDGKCPDHNRKADWLEEDNYFFKLSKYQKPLLEYLKSHPQWIVPKTRYNEVMSFVQQGLEDISITRQTQKWGIPLPWDRTHVIYVWIDALINYLTTIGYPDEQYKKWWPSVHVLGKDIIKFHCIIWPAMLMSAGVDLPKQFVVHGFFTVDGKKISKSLGNVIDPLALSKKYGTDAVRYFLFREIPFGGDGDFSETKLRERYTADLANGLGNLVSRVTDMVEKYMKGTYAKKKDSLVTAALRGYLQRFEQYQFNEALRVITEQIDSSNMLIDEQQPWEMANQKKNKELTNLLHELASRVLDIAELLEPFMPETSSKIEKAFRQPVKKSEPLFPRLT